MFVGYLMRQIHIYDGQRHKDVCLQGDDQDMEDRPAQLQEAAEYTQRPSTAIHNSDKNKYHLTSKHVAVQTQ